MEPPDDEFDREYTAYTALRDQRVYHPGLGMISGLAAAMLADIDDMPPWMRVRPSPPGRCYMVGDSVVHIKPECRCPRRRF